VAGPGIDQTVQGPPADLSGALDGDGVATLKIHGPVHLHHLDELRRVLAVEPRGLILDISSGGGRMHYGEWATLLRSGPPSVVRIGVCLSPAVGLATAADWIYSPFPGNPWGSLGAHSLVCHAGTVQLYQRPAGKSQNGPPAPEFDPRPLTSETAAAWQRGVDTSAASLFDLVASTRGIDPDHLCTHWGGGRIGTAEESRAFGLIDGITGRDTARDVLLSLIHNPKERKNR
jgi:ClpP class serine protease